MKLLTFIKPLIPLAILILSVIGSSLTQAAEPQGSQSVASHGSAMPQAKRLDVDCIQRERNDEHKQSLKYQKEDEGEFGATPLFLPFLGCSGPDNINPLLTYTTFRDEFDENYAEILKIYRLTPESKIDDVSVDSPQHDVLLILNQLNDILYKLDFKCVDVKRILSGIDLNSDDEDPTEAIVKDNFKELFYKVIYNPVMADERKKIIEFLGELVAVLYRMNECCPIVEQIGGFGNGFQNIKNNNLQALITKGNVKEPPYFHRFCNACRAKCRYFTNKQVDEYAALVTSKLNEHGYEGIGFYCDSCLSLCKKQESDDVKMSAAFKDKIENEEKSKLNEQCSGSKGQDEKHLEVHKVSLCDYEADAIIIN